MIVEMAIFELLGENAHNVWKCPRVQSDISELENKVRLILSEMVGHM